MNEMPFGLDLNRTSSRIVRGAAAGGLAQEFRIPTFIAPWKAIDSLQLTINVVSEYTNFFNNSAQAIYNNLQ